MSTDVIKKIDAGTFFGENAVLSGLADETANFMDCLKLIGGYEMDDEQNENEETEEEEKTEETEEQENGENDNEDLKKYKAQVVEISQFCKLAGAESRLAEFIEKDATPDDVRDILLESMSTRQEIQSTQYLKDKPEAENPVIAAAKSRIN